MALAVIAWVWDYIVSWWNYVVDPPARHLKVYFWVVVGVSLAGYFVWAPVVGALKWMFSPVMQAAAPVKRTPMYLLPPSVVITTTRPAPEASVDVVLPTAAKVMTLPAPVKRKAQRKPKAPAWNPFAN
jgi:hypothetical protein